MTTLDLDALERAARAAADGDWRFAADQISSGAKTIATVEWGRGYRPTMAEKNGRFIEAAQPSTILSLISEIRALQERVEGAEKARDDDFCLTNEEQREQGKRCGCYGADDYCPCQNVPDRVTRAARIKAGEPHDA